MTHEAEEEAPVVATTFRDVVVIGGGSYGTFYAGQLHEARARGKADFRSVFVVDRDPACQAVREGRLGERVELVVADWSAFLDAFLDRPAPGPGQPDDAIVPSPLMPHLMAQWLERTASRLAPSRHPRPVPAERPLGTPYDVLAPDGTRYVSFADWLCPTHCIEPAICPVIRAPRTWEMGDALEHYVQRADRRRPTLGPALFVTRHRAFGVGMFDVAEARAARVVVEQAVARPDPVEVVVATISSCHGAVGVLRFDPATG